MLGRDRERENMKNLDIDTLLEINIIKQLALKYGASKTQDIINDFGAKYKHKHENDNYIYSHRSFREAFNIYHKQKIDVFNRYCSLYYKVNAKREDKPYKPRNDRRML